VSLVKYARAALKLSVQLILATPRPAFRWSHDPRTEQPLLALWPRRGYTFVDLVKFVAAGVIEGIVKKLATARRGERGVTKAACRTFYRSDHRGRE